MTLHVVVVTDILPSVEISIYNPKQDHMFGYLLHLIVTYANRACSGGSISLWTSATACHRMDTEVRSWDRALPGGYSPRRSMRR